MGELKPENRALLESLSATLGKISSPSKETQNSWVVGDIGMDSLLDAARAEGAAAARPEAPTPPIGGDVREAARRLQQALTKTPSERYTCDGCGFTGGAEDASRALDCCAYCGAPAPKGGPDHCEACGNSNFMGYACPGCGGRYGTNEEADAEAVVRLGLTAREHLGPVLQATIALAAPPVGEAGDPLSAAAQMMLDDFQVSERHHPDHVLVTVTAFEALRAALSTQGAGKEAGALDEARLAAANMAYTKVLFPECTEDQLAAEWARMHPTTKAATQKAMRAAVLAALAPATPSEGERG